MRPLFLGWDCVDPFEAALKLQFGPSTHWSPLKSTIWKKSWNVFLRNLNFFAAEERKTWTSWMTWGWVNDQEFLFRKWTNPLNEYTWIYLFFLWELILLFSKNALNWPKVAVKEFAKLFYLGKNAVLLNPVEGYYHYPKNIKHHNCFHH